MGDISRRAGAEEGPIRPIEQDTVMLFGHPVRAVRLPDGRIAAAFNDLVEALGLEPVKDLRCDRMRDVQHSHPLQV